MNTESGWFAALGFTNSAITLLPPRWPHSRASRYTAAAFPPQPVFGELPMPTVPHIDAIDFRW